MSTPVSAIVGGGCDPGMVAGLGDTGRRECGVGESRGQSGFLVP